MGVLPAVMLLGLLTPALAIAAPDSKRAKPGSAACTLEMVASGTVATVIDGRTLSWRMAARCGCRRSRSAPPTEPDAPPPPATTETAQPRARPGEAATDALKSLLAGRPVSLRASKLVTDRYGRILADALATRDGYPGSAEKTLLSQGLARLAATLPEPGCLAELRAAERLGRAAKLGLWADPRYLPKQADDVAGLSAERGRFTLVEGKVVSVRESGGTIYVNFGRRWSEDFTVTILKRNERQFIDAGLRPSGLSGRRVMVRGWIEERGGPWIDAMGPEQIEIIAEK